MYNLPPSPPFDWPRAIERNRDALTAILAALFTMLGLQASGTLGRIPRQLHRAVLRVLRPAESATRRLIVIAARGLVVKSVPVRARPQGLAIARKGSGRMAFQLFDTRKRFDLNRRGYIPDHKAPRVWLAGDERPPGTIVFRPEDFGKVVPVKDDSVDASHLGRRLEALKLALADLPRQAKRLVRARMRRAKVPHLALQSPMRPGRAPGYRKRSTHDVDEVLKECHALAREVEFANTS